MRPQSDPLTAPITSANSSRILSSCFLEIDSRQPPLHRLQQSAEASQKLELIRYHSASYAVALLKSPQVPFQRGRSSNPRVLIHMPGSGGCSTDPRSRIVPDELAAAVGEDLRRPIRGRYSWMLLAGAN